MKYNEIVNLFKHSDYKTAITKNMPKDVLETVFNRSLEQGINPFLPIFQIAVETSGKPKLHVKNDNSYNWFNITATEKQKHVVYPVPEYDRKGRKTIRKVKFRVFNSLNDAVDEFIKLIKSSYPNYNKVNYKSLINKNGAAYASADYNGQSYTQMVIDVAKHNFEILGVNDYSIENLQKLFKTNFVNLNNNNKSDILNNKRSRSIKAEQFSKRETLSKDNTFKSISLPFTKKKQEISKNVKKEYNNKTVVIKKNSDKPYKFVSNDRHFKISVNGNSIDIIHSDIHATDKWNKYIRNVADEFIRTGKLNIDYDNMKFVIDNDIKFNKFIDKLTLDYIEFRKAR